MRVARTSLLAILLGVLLALVADPRVGQASGACAPGSSCPGVLLPAPVTITTGRVSYWIERDGHARRVANPRSPFPRRAAWFTSTGDWFLIRDGHLIIGRDRRQLWRSRARFPSHWDVGVVSAGPHAVAFSYGDRLYVAPLAGARPVARGELPVGWIGDSVYTIRRRSGRLMLRSQTGALLETIARRSYGDAFEHGSVYFLTRRALMRARGRRTQRLAWLSRLRLSARPWLSLALIGRGGLLGLQGPRRLVVLHSDGSVFASSTIPRDHGHAEGIWSALAVAPHASAVAFAAAPNENSGYVTQTVYVLDAGAHAAAPVLRERIDVPGCQGTGSHAAVARALAFVRRRRRQPFRDRLTRLTPCDRADRPCSPPPGRGRAIQRLLERRSTPGLGLGLGRAAAPELCRGRASPASHDVRCPSRPQAMLLLRAEAARIATRPTVADWLQRARRRTSRVDRAEVLAALEEHRGPFPGAGG